MLWENVKGGTEQPSAQDIRCVTHGSNQTSQQKPEKKKQDYVERIYRERTHLSIDTNTFNLYRKSPRFFQNIIPAEIQQAWTEVDGYGRK